MNIDDLRYSTREKDWLAGDIGEDNFALRREFEHIGSTVNGLIDAMKQNGITEIRVSGGGGTSTTISSGGDTNGEAGTTKDEKVATRENDKPGYLFDKLKAGQDIAISTLPIGTGGEILLIECTVDMVQIAFAFQGREITINHPIYNAHYTFHIDKPLPDGTLGPLPYETYKKRPGQLWLRFADDTYGFVTLTGRRGAVQVG